MIALPFWSPSHRLHRLPVVTLMPHSRCNCRCIMCDIWKANRSGTSLSLEGLEALCTQLEALETQWVVLSGGEALMHRNLWTLCAALKSIGVKITLLSSGLLLERHAHDVARWCDEIIVSLDGPAEVHDRIRGVPGAYDAIVRGIAALRAEKANYPVKARCVVQRGNFRELPQTVKAAQVAGCDGISFLAADLSSTAFNRPNGWPAEQVDQVGLSEEDSLQFEALLEVFIAGWRAELASGFIAEKPQRLRRIAKYYRATNGQTSFPEVACNAPWVSAVIESSGAVRPCFFHPAYGTLQDASLLKLLNSDKAIAFRKSLDIASNPICQRCVCTLKL